MLLGIQASNRGERKDKQRKGCLEGAERTARAFYAKDNMWSRDPTSLAAAAAGSGFINKHISLVFASPLNKTFGSG